jgi:hypothetical protein
MSPPNFCLNSSRVMMVVLRNDGRLGFEVDFPNTRFVFMNYLGEGFYPEFQEERQ